MKLYEFEGKSLFKKAGIRIPEGSTLSSPDAFQATEGSFAVKAQVLSGKRGKSGAIILCDTQEATQKAVQDIFQKTINKEKVEKILIEQKLDIKEEHYVSITYDTRSRSPVLVLCKEGGVDIEETKEKDSAKVVIHQINIIDGLSEAEIKQALTKATFEENKQEAIAKIILSLWNCFKEFDCRIAEINPLVETAEGYVAADAKVILDDEAMFRHKDLEFPQRSSGRKATDIEIKAKAIDKDDHRGTAGSTFVEMDGNIAVLASGGGASITCMDALIEYGGKPANYTEYSGNPPAEKVERLTEVTLSKKGLIGCWVCGGTANFTDIYETLRGLLEGLRKVQPKPDYPIVVRRAGPRDREAFEMLKKAAKEEGWDFHLYNEETPMTETAKTMVDLANKYEQSKK